MQNRNTLSHKTQKADSQEEAPHPGSEMKMDTLAARLMALAEVLPLGSRQRLSQRGGLPDPEGEYLSDEVPASPGHAASLSLEKDQESSCFY